MYPIPANATRIRYLESTGTQYVDTDIIPQNGDSLSCRFQCLQRQSEHIALFSAGAGSYQFIALFSNRTQDSVYCKYFATGAAPILAFPRNDTSWHTLTVSSSGVFKIEQASVTSNYQAAIDGTPNNLRLFARADGSQQFYGRYASFDYYRGGTLARSFVPVRVGQVGYLFDRVSGQLFGNAADNNAGFPAECLGPDTFQQGVVPTRMMVGGVRKKFKELPDGYTAVDWLDTGFTGTANRGAYFISTNNLSLAENTTKIVANYVCVNNIGEWNVLYTNQTRDNQSGSLCARKSASGLSGFVGGDSIRSTIVYNQPGIAVVDAGSFYVDDVLIGSKATPATNTLTQKFVIGNVTWQASSRRIWPGLIGRISVYSSGVLVANYVPCQEVATSKYGFYDTVSKNFGSSKNASYPFIPATI